MAEERQTQTTLDAIEPRHVERYKYACGFARGKVLDAACGCGYGSSLLAQNGSAVLGVDVSEGAVEFAKQYWRKSDNIDFAVADLAGDWGSLGRYDTVVCLETIEHLSVEPRETLRRIMGALNPGGTAVISFPLNEKDKRNQFHKWFNLTKEQMLGWAADVGFAYRGGWAQPGRRYFYQIIVLSAPGGPRDIVRLDIGGGRNPAPGYIAVDLVSSADIVCDATNVPLIDGSVSEIKARHVLEHLDKSNARKALREWFRLLIPGGFCVVTVPDLEYHARQLLDPDGRSQFVNTGNFEHAMAGFYGWQEKGAHMEHRWGYTRKTLTAEMAAAGFAVKDQISRACEITLRGTKEA